MKIFLVLAALASYILADLQLVIATQEDISIKAREWVYYKDNKILSEYLDSPTKNIVDLGSDRYIMYNTKTKEYVDVSIDEFRTFMTAYMNKVKAQLASMNPGADYEATKKKSEELLSSVKLNKNAKSKEQLGITSQIHEFTLNGKVIGQVRTSKELYNRIKKEVDADKARKLLAEMQEMSISMDIPSASQMAYDKNEKWFLSQGEITLLSLKPNTGSYGRKYRMLNNISEETLDASLFEIPSGYKQVSLERTTSQAWYDSDAGDNDSTSDGSQSWMDTFTSGESDSQASSSASRVEKKLDQKQEQVTDTIIDKSVDSAVDTLFKSIF